MDDVSSESNTDELKEAIVDFKFVELGHKTSVNNVLQSPTWKTVDCSINQGETAARFCCSESPEFGIPSYQVNQSVHEITTRKSENDSNDFRLPLSPVFSPVVGTAFQQFRPPSIHSLGTIAKKYNLKSFQRTTVKCKTECFSRDDTFKNCNVYNNLQMSDQDISWVSSMASPPAHIPDTQFNTIERATFLPEEKFQKIQPRALFSPTSDDNCGCTPLPISSDSEGEMPYQSKIRLSDVCATLNQLEFKSLESELNNPEGEESPKEQAQLNTGVYCPTSPVFLIKPKKSLLHKKNDIVIKSSQAVDKDNFSSNRNAFEGNTEIICKEVSYNLNQKNSEQDDEPFLNLSFTELDMMCNRLLETNKGRDSESESKLLNTVIVSKKQQEISTCILHSDILKKYGYPIKGSSDVEHTGLYFSSYKEIQSGNHLQKKGRYCCNSDLKNELNNSLKTILCENKKAKNSEVPYLEILKNPLVQNKRRSKGEEIDVVETFEEEDEMLRAVEEAEKTLAEEEALMVRAVAELENTAIVDEITEESTLTELNMCVKNQGEVSKIISQTTPVESISQVTKFSTWDSLENIIVTSTAKKVTNLNEAISNYSNEGVGFSNAGEFKFVTSEEGLHQVKQSHDYDYQVDVMSSKCLREEISGRRKNVMNENLEKVRTFDQQRKKSPIKAFEEINKLTSDCEKNLVEVNSINPPRKFDKFDSCSSVCFLSAAGKKVNISEKALIKAKEFMSKCDTDEHLKIFHAKEEPFPKRESEKFNDIIPACQDIYNEMFDSEQAEALKHNQTLNISFDDLSGNCSFNSSKSKNSKNAVIRRNCTVISNNDETLKFLNVTCHTLEPNYCVSSSTPKSYFSLNKKSARTKICQFEGNSTNLAADGSGDNLQYNELQESQDNSFVLLANKSTTNSAPEKLRENKNFGFSTASGMTVKISTQAMVKAREFMEKCDEEVMSKFTNETQKPFPPISRKLNTLSANKYQETNKEKTLGSAIHVGFKTGLGKDVTVTKESLEAARKFLCSCSENPKCEDFSDSSQNQDYNFITASSPKIISKNGSENMKTLQTESEEKEQSRNVTKNLIFHKNDKFNSSIKNIQLGFKTCLGKYVEVSNEALAKAKKLIVDPDQEVDLNLKQSESDMSGETTTKYHSRIDQAGPAKERKKFKNPKRQTPSRTQKSTAMQESSTFASPLPSALPQKLPLEMNRSDVVEKSFEAKKTTERVWGSMPAEEWDNSFKLRIVDSDGHSGEVVKKRKLFLDDSKSTSPTRTGTGYKRPSEDDGAPQKRMKTDIEICNSLGVKESRLKARESQESLIRKKEKVKPCMGAHLKKKTTQKQRPFAEAVKNSLPAYLHKNWEFCINVSESSTYKFIGHVYYEADFVENTTSIQLGDGFEVIPDDENNFGVLEIKRAFLAGPGVQPNLVPHGWVENHYKWIVWKLTLYEKAFPDYLEGKVLTPRNLMLQLKYRYDREIDRNERSALKKILENDDSSVKRMVLRVSEIKKVQSRDGGGYELNLTDGWYGCPARIDPAMARLIDKQKIKVGTKLVIQGAILVNSGHGMSPLEITDDVHLRIFTNSTRRIHWNAKLGFQKNPDNILISLDSALSEGGPISRVDVVIVRVYPMLYSETTSDGCRILRNRSAEDRADTKHKKILEQKLEKIYADVQSEMSTSKNNKECMLSQDAEQDYCRVAKSNSQFSVSFRRENRLEKEILDKVEERLKRDNLSRRNVSELLRAKIVDLGMPNFTKPTILSIWNPNEDVIGLIKEGKCINLRNVSVSNFVRTNNFMHINATRQTVFKSICRDVRYPMRALTPLKFISTSVAPIFGEIDLVGIVVSVKEISHSSAITQIIYLTDSEYDFVGICFWGSYKDYAWDHILVPRRVVACSNLQWKAHSKSAEIPTLHVRETSVFTENPRSEYLKEGLEQLKHNLPKDLNEFLTKCEEKLMEKLENQSLSNNAVNNFGQESFVHSEINDNETRSEEGLDMTSTSSKMRQNEMSLKVPKRLERIQKFGGSSGSPFRWLPYKNV